jgi:hypothetical protein
VVGGGGGGERRAEEDAVGNWTADEANSHCQGIRLRRRRGRVPLAPRPGTSARPTPAENAGRTPGSCHAAEFAVSAIRCCGRGWRLARRRMR